MLKPTVKRTKYSPIPNGNRYFYDVASKKKKK